jgi:predicted kinase
MTRIIALCGVSGVGKTYRRTTDLELIDLPYVDIADIYAEGEDISHAWALQLMLEKIEAFLERGEQAIVVEATFRRRSAQREWLEYLAARYTCQVEYIELDAPLEQCVQRVKNQLEHFIKQAGVSQGEIERM